MSGPELLSVKPYSQREREMADEIEWLFVNVKFWKDHCKTHARARAELEAEINEHLHAEANRYIEMAKQTGRITKLEALLQIMTNMSKAAHILDGIDKRLEQALKEAT